MDLAKEVRDACWNATHEVAELRTAVDSAVDSVLASYGQQSEGEDRRLGDMRLMLRHGFTMPMHFAVATLQDMHELVLVHPGSTESVKWYNPWSWIRYTMAVGDFNRIVSSISVEELNEAGFFARSAMEGLEQGVHCFAELIASDRFDDAREALRGHRGGIIHGTADAEFAYRIIPKDPELKPVIDTYKAAMWIDYAAKPVRYDISKRRRARGD